MHLAIAEQAAVDVFLTTDDGILQRVRRSLAPISCALKTLYLGIGNCNLLAVTSVTDEEFELHAFAILERELGLDGLARFLRLNRAGVGDYTLDRHRWLNGVTIQDNMAEVGSRRRPTSK